MPRRYPATRRPAPPRHGPLLASWLLVHVAFPAAAVLAVGLLLWPIVSQIGLDCFPLAPNGRQGACAGLLP